MNQQKQRIFDRIDDNRAAILDRSRLLFDTPELGYREFETGRLIRGWLESWGVPYESVSYTGLQVTLGRGAPVVAVLAVICSALCYYLYGNALYEMSPLASAIFIILIPLTTMVGGVVLLGESLTWLTVAGGAMIIGSIFLVNMAEAKA